MADAQLISRSNDHPRRRRFARIGLMLIAISGLLFLMLPVIPFLPLNPGGKIFAGGALYGCVQVAWWLGAIFAGPEIIGRLKGWIRQRFGWKQPAAATQSAKTD